MGREEMVVMVGYAGRGEKGGDMKEGVKRWVMLGRRGGGRG